MNTYITKKDFIARCETAYDCWYIVPEMLIKAVEYTNRVQWWQMKIASEIMIDIEQTANQRKLANFTELYKCYEFVSLLSHHCQKCATDKTAWHTRSWFCNCNKK